MKKLYLVSLPLLLLSYYAFKMYSKTVKDEDCITTKVSSRIFDFNTFEIEVDTGLTKSDFKVLNINSGKVIYDNGKNIKGIKNEYGYCRFVLCYKGDKIYRLGHFKTNNWYTYSYTLKLKKINHKISPVLSIQRQERFILDYYCKKI